MEAILILICTIISVNAYIPQIMRLVKTKSSDDISVSSWVMWIVSYGCYLAYVLLRGMDIGIVFLVTLELAFTVIITSLTIRYRKRWVKKWNSDSTQDIETDRVEPTVLGYVARNKNGRLYFHKERPTLIDGAIGLCSAPDGPPSDLEAEVNRYYRDKTKPNCVSAIPFEALAEIARHFADWQADSMVRWQKGIGPSNSMIGSLMLSAYNQGRMDEMMAAGMKQKQQEKKWYETTTA